MNDTTSTAPATNAPHSRNRTQRRALASEQGKNPDLLTDEDAAAYIGMSVSWLRNGRSQQRPNQPRYLKISNRVRYRRSDLDNWLAEHVVEPGVAA